MLTCVNPPGRNELIRLIDEVIDDGIEVQKPFVVKRERSLRALITELHSRKSFADIEWLLVVLAAIAGPQSEVFTRGYEPPKRARGAPMRPVYIDNSDGFFSQAQPVSVSRMTNSICHTLSVVAEERAEATQPARFRQRSQVGGRARQHQSSDEAKGDAHEGGRGAH